MKDTNFLFISMSIVLIYLEVSTFFPVVLITSLWCGNAEIG